MGSVLILQVLPQMLGTVDMFVVNCIVVAS